MVHGKKIIFFASNGNLIVFINNKFHSKSKDMLGQTIQYSRLKNTNNKLLVCHVQFLLQHYTAITITGSKLLSEH